MWNIIQIQHISSCPVWLIVSSVGWYYVFGVVMLRPHDGCRQLFWKYFENIVIWGDGGGGGGIHLWLRATEQSSYIRNLLILCKMLGPAYLFLTIHTILCYFFQTGRGVPVLVPQDVATALAFLANRQIRRSSGIKDDNQYLFANSGRQLVVYN